MQELTRNSLSEVKFNKFKEGRYRDIVISFEQEDYSFWYNLHLQLPQGPDYKRGKHGTVPYLENIQVIESEYSYPENGDEQLRLALTRAFDYIDKNHVAFEPYI